MISAGSDWLGGAELWGMSKHFEKFESNDSYLSRLLFERELCRFLPEQDDAIGVT